MPFHPETIPPEAPCPFCCIKKGDDALKALFFMRGPSRADCDPAIPREYFKIPPAKLDGTGLDSEALRVRRSHQAWMNRALTQLVPIPFSCSIWTSNTRENISIGERAKAVREP